MVISSGAVVGYISSWEGLWDGWKEGWAGEPEIPKKEKEWRRWTSRVGSKNNDVSNAGMTDLLRMLMRQISIAARAAVESLMIFSCFRALHKSPEYPSGQMQ